jgi:hypothetical protein
VFLSQAGRETCKEVVIPVKVDVDVVVVAVVVVAVFAKK